MHKLDILNEPQRIAANHVEGPLLVLAGAGSGKTKVLTERISHLLSIGVPASEILAVTFTNKAAQVMKERVQSITNQVVLTTTFHSLGVRILRESIHELGYQNTFTIYDQKDSENLIKSCLETLGFKDEKGSFKRVKKQISDAKNALISPDEISSHKDYFREQKLHSAYVLYQNKLKEYNALDFDDLLYLTVKLFRMSEKAKDYQHRLSFVLVDEFQDTNQAQYEICQFLTQKSKNLFAVGDPDQSIYSWRGANMNNILNFEKDFPNSKTVTLDQNYRSTNMILQAANALIENNSRSYKKELWSGLGDGDKVNIHQFSTDREEASFVVKNVRSYLESYAPEEIVIFYRTNSQSRIFEDHLLKWKVPYMIIGGLSFYQRREIKDLLAYLRLIVSPADFISFARTINLPKRGIGPATQKKLEKLSEELDLPILTACKRATLSNKLQIALLEYLKIFETGVEMLKNNALVSDILKTVIERSRYMEYLKEDKETFEDRRDNVSELVGKAIEWEKEREEPTLFAFLEELSLKSALDDKEAQDKCIRLMTLHNGKGLEFDVCYLVGMEEDLFPHINSKDSNENLEEERRLCYVGMTRAKKHLYLTSAKYRLLWGSPRNQRPSRFLREIPSEFTTKRKREEKEADLPSEGIATGECVVHKNFGKGIINKRYQTSMGLTYDIFFFEEKVTRSLVAKFAKLTTVAI